jgi:hypothetical protein
MQTFTFSEKLDSPEFTFPRLIGLTGPKGMGKTTFALRIGGEILSLATPIKQMLELIVPKIYIYEEKEKQIPGFPEGITARLLMQRLGTEFGRATYPDIWVNHTKVQAHRRIKAFEAARLESARVIIDDVRFKNEADMIHDLGGELWKVTRKCYVPSKDLHSSEDGLPEEYIDKEIII